MTETDNVISINRQAALPGLTPAKPPATSPPASQPRASTPNPLPPPYPAFVRPRVVNVCWACGTRKPREGKDYCWTCTRAGLATPHIQCMYFEECATVAKRRYRGQQYFICKRHKEKKE